MASSSAEFRYGGRIGGETDEWITVQAKKADARKPRAAHHSASSGAANSASPASNGSNPQTSSASSYSNSGERRGTTAAASTAREEFCRFFQLGQCTKGSKCPFLHKKAPPHFSSEICKFFMNGNCKNGERCPFTHESPSKPAPKSKGRPVASDADNKKDQMLSPQKQPKQHAAAATLASHSSATGASAPIAAAASEVVWRPVPGNAHPKRNPESPVTSPRGESVAEPQYVATSTSAQVRPIEKEGPSTMHTFSSTSSEGEDHASFSEPSSPELNSKPAIVDLVGIPPYNPLKSDSPTSPERSPDLGRRSAVSPPRPPALGFVPTSNPSTPSKPRSTSGTFPNSSRTFDPYGMVNSLLGEGGEYADLLLEGDDDEENIGGEVLSSRTTESVLSSSPVMIPSALNSAFGDDTDHVSSFADAFSHPIPIAGRRSSQASEAPKPRASSFGAAVAPILSPPNAFSLLSPPRSSISASAHETPAPPSQLPVVVSPTMQRKSQWQVPPTPTQKPTSPPIASPRSSHPTVPNHYQHEMNWSMDDLDDEYNPIPSHHSRPPPSTDYLAGFSSPVPKLGDRPRAASSSAILPDPVTEAPSSPQISKSSRATEPPASSSPTPSSSATTTNGAIEKKKQLCMYYLEGGCRFGDYCKFVHGDLCHICNKPYLFPDDPQQNEKHMQQCIKEKEREDARDLVCTLCRKKVVDLGRKFGILPHCSCVFCIVCIKDHRSNHNESECPRCGAPSPFMVPCYGYPRDPSRKAQLLGAYMEKMRKIPCKYFDHGKGACRFGASCHYAHVDDHGNQVVPNQLRSYVDSSGGYTQHSEINLGMFLQKAERRKH